MNEAVNRNANHATRRNSLIFAFLMLITQIGITLVYGFLINVQYTSNVNINSVFVTICLSMLVVVGFGLLFAYVKRLFASALGFTLLINALCIELYPLVNAFWIKTRILATPIINNFSSKSFSLTLTNNQAIETYSNSITSSIKCALALAIAFSSILGRAGPLECFILTTIGTIAFQLNRQIIQNLGADIFGTFFIFTFGGFLGLTVSFLLRNLRQQRTQQSSTKMNQFYTATPTSASFSILGAIFIFVLFPALAYDVDSFVTYPLFVKDNAPLSVILAMASALIAAFSISSFINIRPIIRDVTHSIVAGAIAVGAASFFITNPVYAIVAGFSAGVIQTLIQNLIEKSFCRQYAPLSTISWSLFGVQGLIGAFFATIYKQILVSNTNGFSYTISGTDTIGFNPGYELLMGVISSGMGIGFGLIIGLLILLVNRHRVSQHYTDRTYWISDDGISYSKKISTQQPETTKEQQFDLAFSQAEDIINTNVYL